MGLYGYIRLNLTTVVDPPTIRVRFQNVFELFSLSQATLVFWSELRTDFFMYVQRLFALNRVKVGPITIRIKFYNVFEVYSLSKVTIVF